MLSFLDLLQKLILPLNSSLHLGFNTPDLPSKVISYVPVPPIASAAWEDLGDYSKELQKSFREATILRFPLSNVLVSPKIESTNQGAPEEVLDLFPIPTFVTDLIRKAPLYVSIIMPYTWPYLWRCIQHYMEHYSDWIFAIQVALRQHSETITFSQHFLNTSKAPLGVNKAMQFIETVPDLIRQYAPDLWIDEKGKTKLHHLVMRGEEKEITEFANNHPHVFQASLTCADSEKKTPSEYANSKILRLLIQLGVDWEKLVDTRRIPILFKMAEEGTYIEIETDSESVQGQRWASIALWMSIQGRQNEILHYLKENSQPLWEIVTIRLLAEGIKVDDLPASFIWDCSKILLSKFELEEKKQAQLIHQLDEVNDLQRQAILLDYLKKGEASLEAPLALSPSSQTRLSLLNTPPYYGFFKRLGESMQSRAQVCLTEFRKLDIPSIPAILEGISPENSQRLPKVIRLVAILFGRSPDEIAELAKGLNFALLKEIFGENPLHRLASLGHFELFQFCLEKNLISISPKESEEWHTLLRLAVENGHYRIVELLLKKDNRLKEKDKNGVEQDTPLALALNRWYFNVAYLLIRHASPERSYLYLRFSWLSLVLKALLTKIFSFLRTLYEERIGGVIKGASEVSSHVFTETLWRDGKFTEAYLVEWCALKILRKLDNGIIDCLVKKSFVNKLLRVTTQEEQVIILEALQQYSSYGFEAFNQFLAEQEAHLSPDLSFIEQCYSWIKVLFFGKIRGNSLINELRETFQEKKEGLKAASIRWYQEAHRTSSLPNADMNNDSDDAIGSTALLRP